MDKACIYSMKSQWWGFIVNLSFLGHILGYLKYFLEFFVIGAPMEKLTQNSNFS